MKNPAPLFAACLALSACLAGPRASREDLDARDQAAVDSALDRLGRGTGDYRIGAADLLSVTILDNEKLDRDVRVEQNGTISLPLIGIVRVGGLSVIEAEQLLAQKLKEYVIDPQVTLLIKTEGIKKVFVLGQVLKPGACDLPTEGRLTVLGAISMAGGFTPIAAPNRTRVLRQAGGRRRTFVLQLSAATSRGEAEKDMALEPDDIIFVPQSYF